MEDTDRIRRAIYFDLHGESLKKYFSESNPNWAYRALGKFFHDNGFEHQQGSEYVSKGTISVAG